MSAETQSTKLSQATATVEAAKQHVWQCEEALSDAKRALLRAEAERKLILDPPTWKLVFVPKLLTTPQDLYTTCMQTGYQYALWNGRIFAAGAPGEGMVDTGMLEGDIT